MSLVFPAPQFVMAALYRRPFALLTLGLLPFMAFGAEMEMAMYLGDDEGEEGEPDEKSLCWPKTLVQGVGTGACCAAAVAE